MRRFKRILHPTDFSGASAPALAAAVDLARREHAELIVLHVIEPRGPALGKAYHAAETFALIAKHEAGDRLDAAAAKVRKTGVRCRTLVTTGLAFDEIVETAKREHADLIVLGTHGRTGVSRFLMGSVASRVLQLAGCPVLTVRASTRRNSAGRTRA